MASRTSYYLFQHFKRRLTGCLLFLLYACRANEPGPAKASPEPLVKNISEQLSLATAKIHTGDLITRTGNDFTSYCFRQFCRTDKTYSHCGIASIENGEIYVYHALGGEFNPDQQLMRENLADFVTPYANRGFGIYRFSIDTAQQRTLMIAARAAYKSAIRFDMDFDLATDDKMYCSEFTAKMYRLAYRNDTMFTPTRLPGLEYLAPDNLFMHVSSRLVYSAKY